MHLMKHRVVIVGALFSILNLLMTPNDSSFVLAETYAGVGAARKQERYSPSPKIRKIAEILATDSIEIKQSGKNSLIAKERALAIAARRAFSSLLRDHGEDFVESSGEPQAAELKDSTFSDREISNCVYDYSIENEKHSESIYICAVRYRFDSKRIVSLFQKHDIKCRSDESNDSNIKVAIYSRDFIRNSAKIYTKNCVIQKYSSEYVVLFIRNCTKKEFEKLGLRYALLQK